MGTDIGSSQSTVSTPCSPKMYGTDRAVQNQTARSATHGFSRNYDGSRAVQGCFQGGNRFLAIDVETSAELESGGKVSRDVLDPHKAGTANSLCSLTRR